LPVDSPFGAFELLLKAWPKLPARDPSLRDSYNGWGERTSDNNNNKKLNLARFMVQISSSGVIRREKPSG
jgi:hypothetical protein